MGTRPGDAASYFAPSEEHGEILAEHRHWLQSDPQRYAALLPDGVPPLAAAIQLRAEWAPAGDTAMASLPFDATPWQKCLALGMSWEPDFALLRSDPSGRIVLVAGCVCFPTNWRLSDKIGRPIDLIHDIVPGLNASIGPSIDNFLLRMKPGGCWTRSNWGAVRTPQRNQHPDLKLPKLDAQCGIDEFWLRIEDQALVPLPEVAGVLFGIRIRHISMREVLSDAVASDRVRTALETMTPEVLDYKNLAAVRDRVLNWLQRGPAGG